MPQADLFAELLLLYRAAGRPSYRRISSEIRGNEDMPDTVSHETVSALLGGTFISRWTKVHCVVQQLAMMAVHEPDPAVEVLRFHELWEAEAAARSNHAGPVPEVLLVPAPVIDRSPAVVTAPPAATEAQVGSVPPRNPHFTGRDDLLGVMRARLEGEPWQPLVLHGLGGVGKTSIAVEFVHRESEKYDVVWWIVAEQLPQARSALATLGERREWPPSQDMQQTISSVLGRLESADFSWLIVFDNAAGPEEILPLLPAAGGAVIVTTRDAAWLDRGRAVPVEVLRRKDSIALLRSRSDISFDEADQLAERLGDLPLALEQAAAMRAATRISVVEYLRRLAVQASEVLNEGQPGDYPETVARAFGVTFTQVRRESPAAAQLLALLSCLSAEPVSLTLLRAADEGAIPPPLGRLLGQDARLEEAVRLLRRFGLVNLVDDGQRLQVHRLVQLIVRDSLSEEERQNAFQNARLLLVAADPRSPDNALSWEMYAQIGPHIGPAGLVTDSDRAVRRVVLNQARYLYVIGDFDGSLRLSQEARKAWAGPRDVWTDDQTYTCLNHLANALQSLGRYKEAEGLLTRVWEQLNAHEGFGPNHPLTVRIAAVVAVNRRTLGRYMEALTLERERVEFYRRNADSEPNDLAAARGNLAVILRAIGDFAQAREIDEALVAERTEMNGEGHYLTLFAVSNLARDLYGLGNYADSLRLQASTLAPLRARLGARHPSVILASQSIALGLRKTGRLLEAVAYSREHFHICRGEFGSDHAYTLAAAMTYANTVQAAVAADLASANLSYSLAFNLSVDAVNRYRRRFGERNPLTLAAATNQAIILRAMGERGRARRTGEPAYHALSQELGARHPYTQAAAVGLANDLVAAHEDEEAARLLANTLDIARADGREMHPDMLICAVNRGLIIQGSDAAAGRAVVERSFEALRQELGTDHPQVSAVSRGQRGECEIEPPPF